MRLYKECYLLGGGGGAGLSQRPGNQRQQLVPSLGDQLRLKLLKVPEIVQGGDPVLNALPLGVLGLVGKVASAIPVVGLLTISEPCLDIGIGEAAFAKSGDQAGDDLVERPLLVPEATRVERALLEKVRTSIPLLQKGGVLPHFRAAWHGGTCHTRSIPFRR